MIILKSLNPNKNIFYVYEWIRNDTNQIFYVGKGKDNRYKDLCQRNKHFMNIVNKVGLNNCSQRFIKQNLTEKDAFDLEKLTIKKYREQNIPIVNVSDGGDGSSGWFVNATFEEQERHRQISKSFLGKKHTDETKKKMSLSAKGRHLSDKSKEKIAKANGKPIGVYKDNILINNFLSLRECQKYYKDISEDAIRNAIYKNNGYIRSNYKKHQKYKKFQFKFLTI